MATTSTSTDRDLCRLVLESASDGRVELTVPGTSYRLRLQLGGPQRTVSAQPGKRIRGRIEGRALRMHVAAAGGAFIEPVHGHPRIVQGRVVAVEGNRVLVDMAVPAWLTVAEGQSASEFEPGQLVNMYVESGMTFTPA